MRTIDTMMKEVRRLAMILAVLLVTAPAFAQGPTAETSSSYTLGGLTVLGADYTDVQAIKLFSALQIGQEITIPGEEITRAIRNLWAQDLFSDIAVELAEVRDDRAYIVIRVDELPRLTRYTFQGVSRSEQETLKGKIELLTGRVVNENVIKTARKRLNDHYAEKGYWDAEVVIAQLPDTAFENGARLNILIDKQSKVKVGEILISGTEKIETKKIFRAMKDLKSKKWYRIFKSSKLVEENVDLAKASISALYNEQGYRNASVL